MKNMSQCKTSLQVNSTSTRDSCTPSFRLLKTLSTCGKCILTINVHVQQQFSIFSNFSVIFNRWLSHSPYSDTLASCKFACIHIVSTPQCARGVLNRNQYNLGDELCSSRRTSCDCSKVLYIRSVEGRLNYQDNHYDMIVNLKLDGNQFDEAQALTLPHPLQP